MTNQFKNMVSASSECHQVNPLTALASGMTGSYEKMRAIGSRGVASGPMNGTEQQAAVPIDVREFEKLMGSKTQPGRESSLGSWASDFGQGHLAMARPAQPFHPVAPLMGVIPQQPFFFPSHAPQIDSRSWNQHYGGAPSAMQEAANPESVNDDLAAARAPSIPALRRRCHPRPVLRP